MRAFLVGLALAISSGLSAAALACTADDFGKAVDEAGAQLRAYNADAAPKLNAKLKQLGTRKGWKDGEIEERALSFLTDEKIAAFDTTADELLTRIDMLGRVPAGGAPDCAKLDELKAASLELLAVMKAKTSHSMARLDAELGASPAPAASAAEKGAADKVAAAPVAVPAPSASPPSPAPAAAPEKSEPPKPAPAAPKSAAVPPPAAAPQGANSPGWTTTTEQAKLDDAYRPPQDAPPASPQPLQQGTLLPPEEGYTIDEIREASRGFFGTISTSLASVIEHAFSQSGRPSAYVLGTEGGGAFLAGLRYGEGTLYLRQGGTRKVYWHGPSVGYDFGAAGSRTLFLIYGLRDEAAIFRHYAGVDGSAYVVGGFGITYLQGGGVIMAPIRSGLGLRVGANIGYIRFTPERSWNPF
jgi:hypothetical protein